MFCFRYPVWEIAVVWVSHTPDYAETVVFVWFSCWLRRCFVSGSLRSCVCVCALGIFSLFCNNTVVNSDRSHGFGLCAICGLTGIFGTVFWRWRGSYQLWEFLEAVLLVSKLRSYVLCRLRWRRMKSKATGHMDAAIWSCGSWENSIVLLFTLYWYVHFQEFYFGPSGTVHNWKDFRHNALGPFGHSHFANSVLWRPLSSTSRISVCNIDCGRRKGVWKHPYPVDATHNTMSKWSLGFYTLLSMVECILSAWRCGCANEAHHEKSYRGMCSFLRMVVFQLDWSGLATAAILTGWFAAEWCICICIWCENQTLWLKCNSLSLTVYTVITFRDDVVPYYGACRSISRTLTICQRWSRWLTCIAVIGWCQV